MIDSIQPRGRFLSYQGYWMTRNKYKHHYSSSGYTPEHRVIFEDHYKCCLLPWAIIHHKNGIKNDNRIENLGLTDIKNHMKLHSKRNKFS